jgi:hypothetical protein
VYLQIQTKKAARSAPADGYGLLFILLDSSGSASCVTPEKYQTDLNGYLHSTEIVTYRSQIGEKQINVFQE